MIIKGNKVVPSEGKFLKLEDSINTEFYLGDNVVEKNGKLISVNLSNFDNVKEVYPVNVGENTYFISSTEYGDIVTELIRYKYSINQELALYANFCLGKDIEENIQFQNWRKMCKEVAKKLTNE